MAGAKRGNPRAGEEHLLEDPTARISRPASPQEQYLANGICSKPLKQGPPRIQSHNARAVWCDSR